MIRKSKTVLEEVGDPASTIDEQCRNDRRAPRFLQLTDDVLQHLRRQLVLSSASLRHGGNRLRRSTLRTSRHLERDAVGLQGKSVAIGTGFEERGEQDARFAFVDREADRHGASLGGAQTDSGFENVRIRDLGRLSLHIGLTTVLLTSRMRSLPKCAISFAFTSLKIRLLSIVAPIGVGPLISISNRLGLGCCQSRMNAIPVEKVPFLPPWYDEAIISELTSS